MAESTSWFARAWRAVRNFVSALFGPDQASDNRTTRQGEVDPQVRMRSGGPGNDSGWM